MTTTDRNLQSACLIGARGFVGSHLARQRTFSDQFNSTDIAEVESQAFDTVVCAAAPGSMFEANRRPDVDQAKIEALISSLRRIRARQFVLISSVAVLANFTSGDDERTSDFQHALPYGRNRRMLEAFVETHFSRSLIVRLPSLFGHGLKKNFIFDLLNPIPSLLSQARLDEMVDALEPALSARLIGLYGFDGSTGMLKLDRKALRADAQRSALEDALQAQGLSATGFHNPRTTYQYYDIRRLWADIEIALGAGLSHIHLAVEPLEARHIHRRLLNRDMPNTDARLHREDMQTGHAHLWGKADCRYLEDADTVLESLKVFFQHERSIA